MLKPEVISFIKFVMKEIGIKTTFSLVLSDDKKEFATFAYYNKDTRKVAVYVKDRALADVLRSIAHELVHHKQNENGEINGETQDVGGKIEDDANAIAGQLVKKYGKTIRPDIYSL